MKKITKFLISSGAVLFPVIVLAAGKTLEDIMKSAANYMDLALKVLMGFAVLMFVFNIVMYFIKPSGGESRADASKYVMWSVIGFFVIFTFWGIVNILISTFDLDTPASSVTTSITTLFPK